MKRLLTYVILLLSFFFFQTRPILVNAQSNDDVVNFDTAYDAYSGSIELYNNKHDAYKLARANYLRFRTLKSEDEAYKATLEMLEARDDVIIAYLEALSLRILETPGATKARHEALEFEFSGHIEWFSDHKRRLSSAEFLKDLVSDSNEASKRYVSLETLLYKSLAHIPYGKVVDFSDRVVEQFNLLNAKFDEIKNEDREKYQFSNEKLKVIDDWLFESGNLLGRAQQRNVNIENILDDFGNDKNRRSRDVLEAYNGVLKTIGESRQYLKETTSFLIEVIRQIKTEEQ